MMAKSVHKSPELLLVESGLKHVTLAASIVRTILMFWFQKEEEK